MNTTENELEIIAGQVENGAKKPFLPNETDKYNRKLQFLPKRI